jgi:hypothetical protein
MVNGRLLVASSARNPIVSGPPIIAVASKLMPTTAIVASGATCAVLTGARAVPKNLPKRTQEQGGEEQTVADPGEFEIAVAHDFITTSSPSYHTGKGASITDPIAPWPDDSTIGVASAITPTAAPPIEGRSQTGPPLRRNHPRARSRHA